MKAKLLLLALVLAAGPVIAANAEKPARRAVAERKAVKRELPRVGGSIGGFEQVLTDDQRQKLREYTRAGGEKLRVSQREAMEIRRELQQAVLDGKADEAFIKEKSEAVAKIEAEALRSRMSAMAKVAATLTPEQKEKIKGMSERLRAARPGLGAGPREGDALRTPREPAAPPPPEK